MKHSLLNYRLQQFCEMLRLEIIKTSGFKIGDIRKRRRKQRPSANPSGTLRETVVYSTKARSSPAALPRVYVRAGW
jgi:hypothetical protein